VVDTISFAKLREVEAAIAALITDATKAVEPYLRHGKSRPWPTSPSLEESAGTFAFLLVASSRMRHIRASLELEMAVAVMAGGRGETDGLDRMPDMFACRSQVIDLTRQVDNLLSSLSADIQFFLSAS
jgi:hypothetical protein